MDAIPLIKAKSLSAYVRFLRGVGAPVESGLRRAGLPVLFDERPGSWLSFTCFISFLGDMAAREGIPDLGLRVGVQDVDQNLIQAVASPLLNAPTLFHALQRIPTIARLQHSQLRTWLELHDDRARFCVSLPVPPDTPGHHISESHSLDLVNMVVRNFTDASFEPACVFLASRACDSAYGVEASYRGIPVKAGQSYGAIEIPRVLLCATRVATNNYSGHATAPLSSEASPTNFCRSLEACLKPYLLENSPPPPIAFAAKLANCSVRRLQRELAAAGTSYRNVVEKIRCMHAIRLLRNSEVNITELAMKLGYSEHSAFTRAFRRWTGNAPSECRDSAAQAVLPPPLRAPLRNSIVDTT